MKVVLISGKAGVGKSTVASLIRQTAAQVTDTPWYIRPLATGVKNAAVLMGWDGHKDERGRALLQRVGQLGREYDEFTWVKQALDITAILPAGVIICDDWRFRNELAWCKEFAHRLYTIRVKSFVRGGLDGPLGLEQSEVDLDDMPDAMFHKIVYNNGDTLHELQNDYHFMDVVDYMEMK